MAYYYIQLYLIDNKIIINYNFYLDSFFNLVCYKKWSKIFFNIYGWIQNRKDKPYGIIHS